MMKPPGASTEEPSVRFQTRVIPVTSKDAVAFVQSHGIVLEGARGPVPILAEAVAGERIQGGWRPAARAPA